MPAPELDVPAMLRSRKYLALLGVAAVVGAPIAAVAYWFLYLTSDLQKWIFNPSYLLKSLGFHGEPIWWPVPIVGLAGVLVALTIRYLPGRGGHSPADGFGVHPPPTPIQLPGVVLAALIGLALGAVIGPEAPLIAIGGGLGAAATRLARRAPPQAVQVVGSAGSFSALSTLLGSPLAGAFLLMEASGLGGPTLGLLLMPGLLAAGIGTLVFVGFDSWTGHGTFALALPNLPHIGHPDGAQFGWAIAIGLAAACLGTLIRRLGSGLKPHVEKRIIILAPVVGLVVGGLAVAYAEGTGKPSSDVLFSGQSGLPSLMSNSASYSVGTLALLLACKGVAYGGSLSAFRGGPTFPAIYLGAAGGLLFSHLPGLPAVTGAAMGIAAMTCVMLGLPLSALLVTSLLFGSNGIDAMPVVIVAIVVAYVARAHLLPDRKEVTEAPSPQPVEAAST
jgi:H+/Cl- antiporter ClcA